MNRTCRIASDVETPPVTGPQLVYSSLSMEAAHYAAWRRLGATLAADQLAVECLWTAMSSVADEKPATTVLYYLLRKNRKKYLVLEFLTGRSPREFVEQCEPRTCERELPLFSRVLDAFEQWQTGRAPRRVRWSQSNPVPRGERLKVEDFGVALLETDAAARSHGSLFLLPGGVVTGRVFGDPSGLEALSAPSLLLYDVLTTGKAQKDGHTRAATLFRMRHEEQPKDPGPAEPLAAAEPSPERLGLGDFLRMLRQDKLKFRLRVRLGSTRRESSSEASPRQAPAPGDHEPSLNPPLGAIPLSVVR